MGSEALSKAREWLAGKPRRGTDWMADEIIAALVAEIEAAPVHTACEDWSGPIIVDLNHEQFQQGMRVRLLAEDK